MNARIQWIDESGGWLGQPDDRVATLQGQINTLLGQIPGSRPIEATGVVDQATCQALAGLINSMDSIRWAVQFSATQVNPVIAPSAVFAEAVALCSQWPPKPDVPPPTFFPHSWEIKPGDTLESIGQAVGRVDWQSLLNANPFLQPLNLEKTDNLMSFTLPGSSGLRTVSRLWLPRSWPTQSGGLRPNTLNLPTDFIRVPEFPTGPIDPTLGQNIPRLPFPLPPIPGAQPALVLVAINNLTKAGVACPDLAVVNGPLQHAAMAFSAFATVSIAMGGSGQENLDMLEEQLDNLCPQWRSTSPEQPVPGGGAPPPLQAPRVANLLAQLVLVLAGGATTLSQLPAVADAATSAGLPKLSGNIKQFAAAQGVGEEPPIGPPPEPPTTEAPPKKKKGIGGLALVALAVVGVGIAVAVAGS